MDSLIALGVIAFVIWHFWAKRVIQHRRAVLALNSIVGFQPNYYVSGLNGVTLGLDTAKNRIVFVNSKGIPSLYSYHDILGVDVSKNGISFTKTNRGRQLVTAFAGQMLFGNQGFVVGGTTASTTTSDRISLLSLRIYVNDASAPLREVVFYHGRPIGSNRKTRKVVSDVEEWYARIVYAMAQP